MGGEKTVLRGAAVQALPTLCPPLCLGPPAPCVHRVPRSCPQVLPQATLSLRGKGQERKPPAPSAARSAPRDRSEGPAAQPLEGPGGTSPRGPPPSPPSLWPLPPVPWTLPCLVFLGSLPEEATPGCLARPTFRGARSELGFGGCLLGVPRPRGKWEKMRMVMVRQGIEARAPGGSGCSWGGQDSEGLAGPSWIPGQGGGSAESREGLWPLQKLWGALLACAPEV